MLFIMILILILPSLYGYLIGSVPIGYLIAKCFFKIDITKLGSGNIGATNFARVLGCRYYFFLIFFLDFLKAFFALYLFVFIFYGKGKIELFYINTFLIAFFLLLGNAYSVFLKFKGGKGVSIALGIIAFFAPIQVFIFFIVCWTIVLLLIKRVDVSSLFAIYLTTISFLIFNYLSNQMILYLLIFLCFWLTFTHRSNLKSLLMKN